MTGAWCFRASDAPRRGVRFRARGVKTGPLSPLCGMSDVRNHLYSRISDLAEGQGGFVRRDQLVGLGCSGPTIDSWLQNVRLTAAYRSVYAVGHMPTEPKARAVGAVLAAGDGAALAGLSAGAFFGAVKHWTEPFELLAPRRCRLTGLTVHQSRTLLLRDIWRFPDGLRVTSPARTALDLASRVDAGRLHAIVDHLRLRCGLGLWQLTDIVERNPRHPGAQPLRRVIGRSTRRPTRSGLERRVWPRFAAEYDLPPYEMNATVAGYEVDVLVDGRVIVEIDTFGTHLLNFESDRRRDADILARTGIPTIRVTDIQLDEDPASVAGHILAVVRARR